MNTAGLSLEQAPPFGVVLRFFLTAALFGIIAGALIATGGADLLLGRYHPHTIALIHLLTLGVMAMVMIGALFQMLPVIAGVVLPKVRLLGRLIHAVLLAGILCLCGGLYFGCGGLIGLGGLLLVAALGGFSAAALGGLFRVVYVGVTVQMMRLALVALLVTALMGAFLAQLHAAQTLSAFSLQLAQLHASWALAGWTALLILGVAQQVLPMFYVTPPYPRFCRRVTGWLIFFSLIAALLAPLQSLATIGVLLGLLMLGGTTLLRISQRKRKITDASLRYWQLSMISLLLALPLIVLDHPLATSLAALLFIGGFALGLINGMIYKIVPFLSWFHLSSGAHPDTPMMHDFIPRRAAHGQLWLHTAALVLLAAGLFMPMLAPPGGALLAAAYALLFYHLIHAVRLYRRSGGVF